ncbi:MAG: hypothetical protein M1365_10770 [Actinobacteria bacterium]|nr:hypothetical protein [Actinomycetota bacterium]
MTNIKLNFIILPMKEGDPANKGTEYSDTPPIARSFMVKEDEMGLSIMLARKMTEAGLGDYKVKAPIENDIDPNTGYLFEDGQVFLIKEGQDDFSAYDVTLGKVLDVRRSFLKAFNDEFLAAMSGQEEITKQIDYLRFGLT